MDQLRDIDPDWDACPEQLRQRDGQPVRVEGIDRETGERVSLQGTLVLFPGDFGDAARRREDQA